MTQVLLLGTVSIVGLLVLYRQGVMAMFRGVEKGS